MDYYEYYEYVSGPFIGEIVREGQQILLGFASLDPDLQERFYQWRKQWAGKEEENLDDAVESWENSWESIPTEKKPTLH
jgi:hypothetical protein